MDTSLKPKGLKIEKTYPPNFVDIAQTLPVHDGNLYCYGDTLYNPSGQEIPEDILVHERVHMEQQKDTPPSMWWVRYLGDPMFREEVEIEAYALQFRWIKQHYPAIAAEEAIEEMADNLTLLYNLSITRHQAKTKIRLWGRK